MRSSIDSRVTPSAASLASRDRRLDHARLHAELDQRLYVGGDRAREAPDLGVEAGAGDQLDRVASRPAETRGKPASIRSIPSASIARASSSFCSRVEDDADGLLAVAQRRVVEADRAADRVRLVDRPVQI